jgi:elongator complex protein 3
VPPRKINDLQLFRKEYQTLGGKEIFLSFEDHQRKNLYAFLRLRLPELNPEIIKVFPVLKNSALIREVHTYGEMAKLDEKYPEKIQHLGLGKKLISEAEKIAQEKDYPKIAAIAGIGVRNYFHQLGYRLSQTYMVKNFD